MIIVDTALAKLEEEGRPIRVAIIGAGFQGAAIVRQIVVSTPGMRIVGIANRTLSKAKAALFDVGLQSHCLEGNAISSAIASGEHVITEDAIGLATSEGVDVVVEVTGSIEYAANVVLAAIGAGKHVVHMNAELDGTVGPILKHKADQAGTLYSFSDGDQPGVQQNLIRFVRGLGLTPRLSGNIKGLHDPYRTPDTQRSFAERWGQQPAMVTSFADGTKISFEQAIVANANDFRVARRGMLGPDFSGGDPGAPLVELGETLSSFADVLADSGPGIVDYVVGARPGPGVFVLGTHPDPRQQHFLELYKLGKGPYYCLYTPYHLCHFEVPTSIARVALFRDVVLAPEGAPKVGVIAMAKKDLCVGDHISELGGFEVYGMADNQSEIEAHRHIPLGLALGAKIIKAVKKDEPLRFDDVQRPSGRTIDILYEEQRAL